MTATPDLTAARSSFGEALAVYLKPRVLIVLFLGFSAGLPLALSGSTLRLWMRQSGVDLETIGLFALVGTPYTIKFLWAPVVDALDAPVFSRLLGRRRGWLVLSQVADDGGHRAARALRSAKLARTWSSGGTAGGDRFRHPGYRRSTPSASKACPRTSRPPAWRPMSRPIALAILLSTAGALFIVSGFVTDFGFPRAAWTRGYLAMALLVLIGVCGRDPRIEPEKSAAAQPNIRPFAARSVSARDGDRHRRLLATFSCATWRIVILLPSWCCSNSPTRLRAP